MSKFLKIFTPSAAGAAAVLGSAYFVADQFIVDVPAPLRTVVGATPVQAEETGPVTVAPVMTYVASSGEGAPSRDGGYGLGRAALAEEVAAWNIDVRPDGQGLPVGSMDVFSGEEVFVEKCASCHGDFGEAVGRWPVLAGGHGSLEDEDPVKTIGSYWPYLSTVYDYIYRAMPFGEAESLTHDEVYGIVAYLLYVNDIVDDEFELSNENFLDVRLPNEANFYPDDRMDVEFPVFVRPEICMSDCKDTVEVTMRASVLDVTPEETAAKAAEAASQESAAQADAEEAPAAEADAGVDMAALADAGSKVFKKCQACHQVGEGAVNRSGPLLNGLMGRVVGSVEGFNYSGGFADAAAAGETWTAETLAAFLTKPKEARPGTKMAFAGLRSQEDIDAVLAYIAAEGG